MPSIKCPDRETLTAFALGKLPPCEIEIVTEHVDQCPTCESLLATIDGVADSFVAELQPAAMQPAATIPPECERMMAVADSFLDVSAPAGGAERTRLPSVPDVAPLEQVRDYRLLEKLGEGGMGEVYKALHTRLDRVVALKLLLPAGRKAIARFEREMKAAGKLEHPNLVMAHDAGEAAGRHFLVMEYVPGVDLSVLVARHGRLSVADACDLVRQAALGLECAHQHGLVHRDIKPSNLMLTTGGTVKVLDLGLALLAGDAPAGDELTGANQMMGTADYIAPEQVGDSHSVDIRADIYSLGCTLYKLLAGHAPFTGPRFTTAIQKMMAHIETHVPPLAAYRDDIPPELSTVLERMLAKLPSERFATPAAVASALVPFAATHDLHRLVSGATPMMAPSEAATINTDPYLSSAMTGTRPAVDRKREIPEIGNPKLPPAPSAPLPSATRVVPRRRRRMIAVTSLAAALALLSGVVIIVRDHWGNKVAEIETEDGAIVKPATGATFEIRQSAPGRKNDITSRDNGGESQAVTNEHASGDPDRRAAVWVLSIGGKISIKENGKQRKPAAVDDLPQGPFELTEVSLYRIPKVSDEGLAVFEECKNLTYLVLVSPQVSDAGLAHLKNCKNLTYLTLGEMTVSDQGLAVFRNCKNLKDLMLSFVAVSDAGMDVFRDCKDLTYLYLASTQVSDAGLAVFQNCKSLTSLGLTYTQVTDVGLVHFKDCKNLTALVLNHTQAVSDKGLAIFKDRKNLTELNLNGTKVGDAGLAHFNDCQKLAQLNLGWTEVTDAGLARFKGSLELVSLILAGTRVSDSGLANFKDCKKLTALDLRNTKLSDAALPDLAGFPKLTSLTLDNTRISLRGHEQLHSSLPNCEITWSETNRSVAESVLALGGSVDIGTPGQPESHTVMAAADLPREYFQVRRVSLAGVAKPLDQLPDHLSWLRFPNFDRLESLDLAAITGLDYGFMASIDGLRELSLTNAGLNDQSLAKLPKLPNLKRLVLDGNEIYGAGLTYLREQPELTDLSLGCPTLKDLPAKNLTELKQLKRLSLAGSGLTNVGIKQLAAMSGLEWLDLRGTAATAAGVAELQESLLDCRIELDDADGTHPGAEGGDAPELAVAPFDAKQARAHQQTWAKYLDEKADIDNSLGMNLRLIPPGEFRMGSRPAQIDALTKTRTDLDAQANYRAEGPQHQVQLTKPFYLGTCEVTQKQYQTVMGGNPSHFSVGGQGKGAVQGVDTGQHPVEMASWFDAVEFCNQLSDKEQLPPHYAHDGQTVTVLGGTGYRLPTEAEWEYACRAGGTSRWSFGDDEPDLAVYARFSVNSGEHTHPVGQLAANPFGLCDMHGNVWEWNWDWWHGDYADAAVRDPTGSASGTNRVIRGGSYSLPPFDVRSAIRGVWAPVDPNPSVGFRIARTIDLKGRALPNATTSDLNAGPDQTAPNGQRARPPAPAIFPFDAKQARAYQEGWAKHLGAKIAIPTSSGMQLRFIPPGEFLMGSVPAEIDTLLQTITDPYWQRLFRSEGPQHRVRLTKPFYLSAHEVTQRQYQAVMGVNPSHFSPGGAGNDAVKGLDTSQQPVEMVSWLDAVDFCNKLSVREQLSPYYARSGEAVTIRGGTGYRLPTEAEWEYACRSGSTTRWSFGDHERDLGQHAVFGSNCTNRVGELAPNPFGLYDLYGNVWEWCWDWHGEYAAEEATDPTGAAARTDHVLRGGSFAYGRPSFVRSANRDVGGLKDRRNDKGFRVARTIDAKGQ